MTRDTDGAGCAPVEHLRTDLRAPSVVARHSLLGSNLGVGIYTTFQPPSQPGQPASTVAARQRQDISLLELAPDRHLRRGTIAGCDELRDDDFCWAGDHERTASPLHDPRSSRPERPA